MMDSWKTCACLRSVSYFIMFLGPETKFVGAGLVSVFNLNRPRVSAKKCFGRAETRVG